MLDIIAVFCGLLVGLFLWSNIYGGLFATLPLQRRLKKDKLIEHIDWRGIIVSIALAISFLLLTAWFWKMFFYGAISAGVIMLFFIGRLKVEAIKNASEKYGLQL